MKNIKEIREAPVKHQKKTNPDHHYISTISQNPTKCFDHFFRLIGSRFILFLQDSMMALIMLW